MTDILLYVAALALFAVIIGAIRMVRKPEVASARPVPKRRRRKASGPPKKRASRHRNTSGIADVLGWIPTKQERREYMDS